MKNINLVGQTFNRLTVLDLPMVHDGRRNNWVCKCTCGNITNVPTYRLLNGETKSCGCFQKEGAADRLLTHGLSTIPEYDVWNAMKDRCSNPNNKDYMDYGGRGIIVCRDWLSFDAFIKDMGRRPSSKHQLERVENDGNYEPLNCVWATIRAQRRNRRNNRWYEYNGKRMILNDWATLLKVRRENFRDMLKRKSFEETYEYYLKNPQNA